MRALGTGRAGKGKARGGEKLEEYTVEFSGVEGRGIDTERRREGEEERKGRKGAERDDGERNTREGRKRMRRKMGVRER